MRYRHRILAALLVASIVCSMISCKRSDSNEQLQATTAPTAVPTATPTPEPTHTPKPTPTPAPTDAPAPTAAPRTGVDLFEVGSVTNTGYYSSFFDFGFKIPEDWSAYDRLTIDSMNNYPADSQGKTTIEQLKEGDVILEYFAYEKDLIHIFYVFVADTSSVHDVEVTEFVALSTMCDWLFDFDGDDLIELEHFDLSVENILGKDRLVFRYDDRGGETGTLGAVFSVQRGTTYAFIQVASVEEDAVDELISRLYQPA